MTIYHHDGFGQYGAASDLQFNGYTATTSSLSSIEMPFPDGNGKWITFDGGGSNGTFRNIINPATGILTSLPTHITAQRFYIASPPNSNPFSIALMGMADSTNASLDQWTIGTNGAGFLQFYRGATAIGPAGHTQILMNTWYALECEVVVNSSSGSVQAYLNGAQEIALTTGLNTQNSSSSNTDQQMWHGGFYGGTRSTDAYLLDPTSGSAPWNTFLSQASPAKGWRVITETVNANSGSPQFTPNGLPANWQNVATFAPGTNSNFNSAATSGLIDAFTITPMPNAPEIFAVILGVVGDKNNAGTRSLIPQLTSGVTTVNGATTPMATSKTTIETMFQIDPATSAQWLYTAVNASIPGYESA